MAKPISVRLPDQLVEFVDNKVASGAGRSRAAIVIRALEREQRREIATRDAEILAERSPDSELADVAKHAVLVAHPLP